MRDGGAGCGAGVRKPPKEETAGRKGRCLVGRDLWGFEDRGRLACASGAAVAGSLAAGPATASVFGRENARAWRRGGGRRRTGDLVRASSSCSGARLEAKRSGVARREARRRDHEVSILIRFGDGDRAGRAPSNVSMMIIRPPQHGHRRAGEGGLGLAVCLGGRRWAGLGRGEQLSGALDVAGANRAGEQAVVADAVEAARQHVQEKAADELGGVERHGLEPVAAFDAIVLPFEGDALLVERDEPGVGDRDAMGVAGEIGEHGLRSGERSLGVDDPIAAAQRRERGVEGALVGERARDRRRRRGGRPACRAASPSRKRRRNRRDSTRTGRKKPGLQAIQRDPSGDRPPPGTMTWTCGWWVSAEPQVCSTAVRPMRAPRCFGSAAMVVSVSAAALNRRS